MSKLILADSSTLVNFFDGIRTARKSLEGKRIWIASVTEIELLVAPTLLGDKRILVESFLKNVSILELTKEVRLLAIQLRLNYSLGLTDSIIAASAQYLSIPLVTYDYDFKKVENLIKITFLELNKK
jgi:predicted nucleic acid-binding protein